MNKARYIEAYFKILHIMNNLAEDAENLQQLNEMERVISLLYDIDRAVNSEVETSPK